MKLRLASHNIWNNDTNSDEWASRGEDCSASARVGGLVRIYKDTLPDIIGFQEMTALMSDLIVENCAKVGLNYTLIWGRFTPIMYRADKLDLLETRFFTYPDFIDGYEGEFNDIKSKSFSSAVFRDKSSEKIFVFTTTHLWWQREPHNEVELKTHGFRLGSDDARKIQLCYAVNATLTLAKKYDCPAFIVGDFNADYNSKAVTSALNNGFKHAHDIATYFADESMGYHWCYANRYDTFYYDKPFSCAIDHIIVYNSDKVTVKNFARYSPDYYYPISDHSIVFVDIEN